MNIKIRLSDISGTELKVWMAADKCPIGYSGTLDINWIIQKSGLSKSAVYKACKTLCEKGIFKNTREGMCYYPGVVVKLMIKPDEMCIL